jgi:hypothetical protein
MQNKPAAPRDLPGLWEAINSGRLRITGDHPGLTVPKWRNATGLHNHYCDNAGGDGAEQQVTIGEYLQHRPRCLRCADDSASPRGMSPLLLALRWLIDVNATLAAAHRTAARAGTYRTTRPLDKATKDLGHAERILDDLAADGPAELTHVVAEHRVRLRAAAEAVSKARTGPTVRDRALQAAHDALVSAPLRPYVRLDESPVLVAMTGVPDLVRPAPAADIIDLFTVRRTATSAVLAVPQYVIQYLSRCADLTGACLQTIPATGLDPAVADLAVALWDPDTPGPLLSLTAAVTAAHDLHTTGQ